VDPSIKQKASFFVNFGRIETDDNELDPRHSPRQQLNDLEVGERLSDAEAQHVLQSAFRLRHQSQQHAGGALQLQPLRLDNQGVGGFHCRNARFNTVSTNHTLQLTETAILNPTTINETRFQYTFGRNENIGDSECRRVRQRLVQLGSSQVGNTFNERSTWELNNFTAKQMGPHAIKFGGRVRHISSTTTTKTTSAARGPLPAVRSDQHRALSVDAASCRSRDLRPNRFARRVAARRRSAINSGNPFATVDQTDLGVFTAGRLARAPNITLSYGLRYEIQTNTPATYDFAPRVAVRWSPGAATARVRRRW
jgi:hypothetical protein